MRNRSSYGFIMWDYVHFSRLKHELLKNFSQFLQAIFSFLSQQFNLHHENVANIWDVHICISEIKDWRISNIIYFRFKIQLQISNLKHQVIKVNDHAMLESVANKKHFEHSGKDQLFDKNGFLKSKIANLTVLSK